MKLIYIAGPMSAQGEYSLNDNVKAGVDAYIRLIHAGAYVFSPHLCALAPDAFSVNYEKWMTYDFAIISRCDALLMLPRWKDSSGARREHEFAMSLGKSIFYEEEDLIRWIALADNVSDR